MIYLFILISKIEEVKTDVNTITGYDPVRV